MFVRQSTYDKAIQQRDHEQSVAVHWQIKHSLLLSRWNDLVSRLNEKGGEQFISFGKLDKSTGNTVHQFTDDELRSLL